MGPLKLMMDRGKPEAKKVASQPPLTQHLPPEFQAAAHLCERVGFGVEGAGLKTRYLGFSASGGRLCVVDVLDQLWLPKLCVASFCIHMSITRTYSPLTMFRIEGSRIPQ